MHPLRFLLVLLGALVLLALPASAGRATAVLTAATAANVPPPFEHGSGQNATAARHRGTPSRQGGGDDDGGDDDRRR